MRARARLENSNAFWNDTQAKAKAKWNVDGWQRALLAGKSVFDSATSPRRTKMLQWKEISLRACLSHFALSTRGI